MDKTRFHAKADTHLWRCALQNTALLSFLLANFKCETNEELFCEAVWLGCAKFLEASLNSFDPAINNNYGIRYASLQGHVDVVKLLLSTKKVDPSADGQYALKRACVRGYEEIVQLLLKDDRVDPSVDDNYAFRAAAAHGHAGIVLALLKHPKVKPSAEDIKYALEWAVDKKYLSVFVMLHCNIKIFIGNLSWQTKAETLTVSFSKYGRVIQSTISKDHATGKSLGYGFVVMAPEGIAAIDALNETSLDGRKIRVSLARKNRYLKTQSRQQPNILEVFKPYEKKENSHIRHPYIILK
ncbi:UNVERIFIED_CONTAM: hypothetical protein HDU68_000930 [Siphonaria sp. JEL0065]|nr:hypothetical protein HDU68_000930 [Siphonaria sp. JEL0065]